MYEVILYAAIATIVCAVLYSVLGRSSGEDGDHGLDPITFRNDTPGEKPALVQDPIQDFKVSGLKDVIKVDPQFSPGFFLDGSKGAYSMILEAFAEGNRDTLKDLLSSKVYAVYDAAITDRDEKNLTQITDLARLKQAEITHASVEGGTILISVQFDAELSSALVDADGQTVEGDPDLLSSISEVWTFERAVKSSSQDWLLSDVEPASGDDLSVDPSPDTTPESTSDSPPDSQSEPDAT